jgi:Gram-negative bacterial TonB protein C-terminal
VSSDSVIAIPPETSWTGTITLSGKNSEKQQDSTELINWLHTVSALNGLQSTDVLPWHIVIIYDQFDEDGDNVHSGVFEEFWAGPKKYRISYKSDNLNQTDYATDDGLFRLGDQRWPNPAEIQVRARILDPFSYAANLQHFRMSNTESTFGTHSLHCVGFQNASQGITAPAQYCFDDGSVLRYVRGEGWFQTAYNDILSIDGRKIAQDVEVTDGGKPFLKLHVKVIETISQINDKDFVPPPTAINLLGKTVSGISPKPIQTSFPEWPMSLQHQHFSVTLDIVIGKDGHVVSAHAISGPPDAYKAAEKAAQKWVYQPYLVLDQPTEVETKINLNNN